MSASANLESEICNLKSRLVRLGHLCFDDFLLVAPETLDVGHWTSDLASDWAVALNNAPQIELHFRPVNCRLQPANCRLAAVPPSLADVLGAQQCLVTHFAIDLLKTKAPPLYDALPWQDWDFSIVAKRFKLWQTRFLLAGDGTTVAMCHCRKSAGVYVLEPCETIARYIERKAVLERIRRFRLLELKAQAKSLKPLSEIPLPDNSVDLAILGSCPDLATGDWKLVTDELIRVAANVLLVENNPLSPPLAEAPLTDAGFRPDTVEVSGLGPRRCWWLTA
jgi:hypothetical protein